MNLNAELFGHLLLNSRHPFRDSGPRVVIPEVKVMRQDVLNSLDRNVDLVVPFLTGSEENLNGEGLVGFQLLLHGLEA